jgi:hypothetical protein
MTLFNLAILTLTVFFNSSPAPRNYAFAYQAHDVQQPYSWGGSSGDLSVNLWLVRDRDSVYARGTYEVAPTKKVGCGGESLPAKGRVTMRAKGNFEAFTGRLLFDTGWTPPFSAKKNKPDHHGRKHPIGRSRPMQVAASPRRTSLERTPLNRG